MRITDAQDTNPNYIHRCGTASEDVTVLVTPTNKAVVQSSEEHSTAQISFFLRSTTTEMRSQGSLPEPTSGSSSPSNDGTTTTSTSENTWKYAVIGICGVIVLLSLIGVIFCLWKRARKIKKVINRGPGIGHQPIPMQYMETVDGSVMGEMTAEKKDRIGDWARSQSGRPLHTVPENERETLIGSISQGRH